ncbi:SDR family NAD(P)-dependent oxidoreductase [Rhizobium leguminosarum]|uniref:SDR family NAD(P)-dependent oxidoreductase n=1 Tax=Rhizobium leguminosarum TaxID=384 RepID=UPI0017E7C717|nr:SDR family NAD(P)-dependent oxidoreductase [Rhizobium leguminosarum]MBB4387232.1 short-subunit dehydrogenase [Rhizobium leguminosarum]MBB4587556.1 short-subunit dehydrogenase [Rhizobium leguminosarum]
MRVIILGATSAIASAAARLYAAEGASLLLVGRDENRLAQAAADLKMRGAETAEVAISDLGDPADVEKRLDAFVRQLGGVDHVLLAYGILGNQGEAERNLADAETILRVNFNSAAAWCLATANIIEKQGRGTLAVIGSVAGDRGRRANFIYGASKAGLEALVVGIAHRFADKGPRAVLIKPGPTMTPMTEGMNRKGALWAKPEQVAAIVHARAYRGGPVAYAPGFWRYIMLIIRNLPSAIFNRMEI